MGPQPRHPYDLQRAAHQRLHELRREAAAARAGGAPQSLRQLAAAGLRRLGSFALGLARRLEVKSGEEPAPRPAR